MKEYYVYAILDPRWVGVWEFGDIKFGYKPFYIGKGKGDRSKQHFFPSSLKSNTIKNNIIKTIIKETCAKPKLVKVKGGLSETEAFELECELIRHFGRLDENNGILANHTNGGEGHSGYHQPKLTHRKVIYQYDLSGDFIKKWGYLNEVENDLGLLSGNISTAVKRGGTAYGYIWSYEYSGTTIDGTIKYQMPNKFTNIKQLDKTGKLLKTFDSALDIEKELELRDGARNKIYECINGQLKTAYGYKWEI